MIQANEVRLGNLVNYRVNNEPLHIGKITGLYVTNDDQKKIVIDYHYPGVFGEPIELSPDILERCGFVEKGLWFYKENFILGYITDESHFQTEYKMAGNF